MKLAIMQPYLFPHLSYFQLINAVDKFVFYDDVNYIKGGWINRNYILVSGKKQFFTLQLKKASSYRKINEIQIGENSKKIIRSLAQAYSKTPYFKDVFPLIESVFTEIHPHSTISDIAIKSVQLVCRYLNILTKLELSSLNYMESQHLKGETRICEICKLNQASTYINSAGGVILYNKQDFIKNKIQLFFIKSNPFTYKQNHELFISGLSILDLLMFNSRKELCSALLDYNLA